MSRIGVIGAGAFGTALACVEASDGTPVVLWGRDPAKMAALAKQRENAVRLPGVALPPAVRPTADLRDLAGVAALLLALPAQETDGFLAAHGADLPDVPLLLCAKGLGRTDFRRQSEMAAARVPGRPHAVLTGPGFAAEIGRGLPTALTLACADRSLGRALQERVSRTRLRLYLTDDVVGAELGGALKNVIAIACGAVAGAELGASAQAALMTRGFAEMVRLVAALGARPETLAGLSGLGDLSLTCNSPKSRNFAFGFAYGAGRPPQPGVTVEGVATARAACELAARHGVELPIAAVVADVIDGALSFDGAMAALLARPLREE